MKATYSLDARVGMDASPASVLEPVELSLDELRQASGGDGAQQLDSPYRGWSAGGETSPYRGW